MNFFIFGGWKREAEEWNCFVKNQLSSIGLNFIVSLSVWPEPVGCYRGLDGLDFGRTTQFDIFYHNFSGGREVSWGWSWCDKTCVSFLSNNLNTFSLKALHWSAAIDDNLPLQVCDGAWCTWWQCSSQSAGHGPCQGGQGGDYTCTLHMEHCTCTLYTTKLHLHTAQ